MAKKWPTGIRPSGKGIRVTIWRHGRAAYDKTIAGDPYSQGDLNAAVKHREKLLARLKLGQPLFAGDEGSPLFEHAAQGYIDTLPRDGHRENVRSHLNRHWLPVFTGRPVTEIMRAEIRDRVSQLPLKPTTRSRVLGSLRAVLDYAEVYPNPAYKIPTGRSKAPTVDRYTPQERDALLGVMEGQAKVYFAVLFATGIRPGEARALTWADYDGEYLHINKQWTRRRFKDSTKTLKDRRVYVPKWARPILNAHSTRLAGGAIFTQRDGDMRTSDTMNKDWRDAHKKARVGAHRIRLRRPYTTRHTRASEMLSMGVSAAEAAAQLGHSVQMFLGIYAAFMDEYASKDMSRLEGTPAKNQRAQK